ncbi:MAG: DUF3616 domain-containing protein, partial [Bacteroidota bacterium]
DYTLSNNVITIPASSASGSVTFTVNNALLFGGSKTAILTLSSPSSGIQLGTMTTQNITILDDANAAPTISMNVATTSDFIDGGVTVSPASPYVLSGVIGDVTDPAYEYGIYIDVLEDNTIIKEADYIVDIASNSSTIVNQSGLIVTKESGRFLLKIKPAAVGKCTITITVEYHHKSASVELDYAASEMTSPDYLFHTGISDASAAILINDTTMLIGDDETNQLCFFHTRQSGLPLRKYNYEQYISLSDGLPDNKKEADIECCARSILYPSIVYWLGSMSNGGKRFDIENNRNTLFATTFSETDKEIAIKCSEAYHELRKQLISWGNKYGYNLEASAASGQKPKQLGGFNIEGLVFGPDSTTLYIGFRAPQVPVSSRNNALIAPILNFEKWFNEGKPKDKPTIGKPIEINLNGRGIRDIIRLYDHSYLIIAGNADAVRNAALYKWTGLEKDPPIILNIPGISNLAVEAAVELMDNGKPTGKIQLICDDGSTEWYNDGNAAKNLDPRFKKFRSKVISLETH